MSVSAYVLIQTEVGRAEKVATAARDIAGVVAADNVAGPYDVIVKTEAADARRSRPARGVGDPEGRRHHPHVHLPRRQPLTPPSGVVPVLQRHTNHARTRSGGGQRWRPALAVRRGVAGEREVDEAIEQLGVRHAGRLPQPRVHRDRGEPGNRVHLVDQEGALGRQEQVDPGHRLAPARLEGSAREQLRLRELLVGERRGHQQLGVVGLVLVDVGVEVVPGHDLAGHRHRGRIVAEHRELDLATGDRLLHHDPLVVRERKVARRVELGAVPCLRDTDRRAEVGRLHEAGVTEPGFDLLGERGAVVAVAERDRPRVRQVRCCECVLHRDLVHPDRGADDARAHVRQVGQLEQPLHRAVLAVGPVEQGEHDIDVECTERRRDLAVDREGARQRGRTGVDGALRGVGQQPPTVGGDRHRHDLVALAVECPRHRDRGHA